MRTITLLLLGLTTISFVGCKKKTSGSASPAPTAASAPATPAPAPESAGVDPRNTNYQAGGGAVQNVRQAARRTVQLNDMHQLGQLITLMYNESGRMPNAATIRSSIQRDAPNIAAAINEGSIILTGTTNYSGLWAYEVDADKRGGIGLVGGTASRMSADLIKQQMGR